MLGLLLRSVLPDHHRASESRDVVRLGMGLLATMAALVLSLMISSAKGSYDTQRGELTHLAANIGLLDRVLAHYGPEAADARDHLRRSLVRVIEQMWPTSGSRAPELNPTTIRVDALYERIQSLVPQNDVQRSLRAEALKIATEMGLMRSLLFAQSGTSIPLAFLVILVFWITLIFVSFGLFAPLNATVVVMFVVCALSVSCAIFLILELDEPFRGFIHLSSTPLRSALANLGR